MTSYDLVLSTLTELEKDPSETGAKAHGLKEVFSKTETILGLVMSVEAIEILENLNKSLQSRDITCSGT